MKNKTLKTSLLTLSCIILTALGFTILNADSTTTIGLDINTGDITSTGTITSQDLTIQKSNDTTLTIYSNTDSPTDNDKLLIIQKGTTPLELFSVDEDGDVVIGNDLTISNDLAITGNVTLGNPITTQYGGTGSDWSTTTQGNLPYFSDTGTLSNLAPGTNGQFLSQGSDGNPAWDNVVRTATFVIAASNSLNKEQADYVCSGEDDQVEIQAAIDAVGDLGGGKVVLMKGTFNCSDKISVKDNVCLIGSGTGTEIGGGTYIEADGISNFEIRNLFLNGYPRVNIIDSSDFTVDNIKVLDMQGAHGIWVSGTSHDGVISNCILDNCIDDGIAIGDGSPSKIIITNNIARNGTTSSVSSGIEVDDGATQIIIDSNICYGNKMGITVHSHPSEPVPGNVIVSNNYCYQNLVNGIEITGTAAEITNGVIIANNILEANVGNGMRIGGSTDIIMHGNYIVDNGVDGIFLLPPFSRIKIMDNHILNSIEDGIGITPGTATSEVTIQGNTVINSGIYGMHLVNISEIMVIGNRIKGTTSNYGIYFANADIFMVNDNIISECGRAGIRTTGTMTNGEINDNIVYNNGQNGGSNLHGILCEGHTNLSIIGNVCIDSQIVKTQQYGIVLYTSSYTTITDNVCQNNATGSISLSGNSNVDICNNAGYTTESSGTATLANTTTSIVVTHGLDVTPSAGDITVTPIKAWGAMTEFYIDTYTSTQFTIHADQNPTQDVDFAWKAVVL